MAAYQGVWLSLIKNQAREDLSIMNKPFVKNGSRHCNGMGGVTIVASPTSVQRVPITDESIPASLDL